MFKAKKIRKSLCLQPFLTLSFFFFFFFITNFSYGRYFIVIVPSFEFIVVFIRSFSVVFEKLFSYSNPLSLLINILSINQLEYFVVIL